jgi:hypothetical protein
VDLADRRRVAGERRPAADALEDAPAALGHRGGAIVVARLRGIAGRRGLDDQRPSGSAASATASEPPTMPPPAMTMSKLAAGVAAHVPQAACISRSISSGSFGASADSTSAPARVTSTSSSMRMPMPHHFFGDAARARRDVEAGLDRQHHARLEHAPLVADLVVADVVHVHAQPVAGAVHVEAAVGAVLDQRRHPALEQPERTSPRVSTSHRGVVRLVPVVAGAHLVDRRELRLQHHLVERALLGAEAAR